MTRTARKIVSIAVATAVVVACSTAAAGHAVGAGSGSYAGKIRPTDASDSNSDTKIRFKLSGHKITKLKAVFYYGCFVGGSYTLQYYVFPSVHKGPIKVRANGAFSAKDVVDKQTGFVVRFSGRLKGSSAKGKISLQTTTKGVGCGRKFTWKAKRH
jgi:hypothetical protein